MKISKILCRFFAVVLSVAMVFNTSAIAINTNDVTNRMENDKYALFTESLQKFIRLLAKH